MKSRNFIKSGIALGLALGMTVTGTSAFEMGTITAAAKPKLSKKKITVTKGDTATLKVKNAKKKVKWTSNKKKIVKITKLAGKKKEVATIKAVGAGKAVVTAKVGKKKLTCKVTAKKPVDNFKAVAVDNFDTTCVVLNLKKADKKHPVLASNLTVTKKSEKNANYNKEVVVNKVVPVNSTQYRVYLEGDIDNGEFVQIKSGVSTTETQFKLPVYTDQKDNNVYIAYEKGTNVTTYLSSYVNNTLGATKVTLEKGTVLPAGLTLDSKYSCIKGIPTTVGNTTFKATVQDELGRKVVLNVTFAIYDETAITASDVNAEISVNEETRKKVDTLEAVNSASLNKDKNYYTNYTIAPKGGSGTYKFTLETPDDANVCLSTDKYANDAAKTLTQKTAASTELQIPYSLLSADGTHTYKVTATDVLEPSRTCTSTITVNVTSVYKLSGLVKSSNGQRITGTTVSVIPVKANSLDEAKESRISASSVGMIKGGNVPGFEVEVPAGEYIIKVDGDVQYQMNGTVKVDKADKILNVTVPAKFYSVSAVATYANAENKLKNKTIHFETKANKYERSAFTTITDEEGNFNVVLPNNTYCAYIEDEKGNRKYFASNIVVNGKDQILKTMSASIARYSVEGVVLNGTSVDPTSNLSDTIKDATLYFYKPTGEVVKVQTDERGAYKAYLEEGVTYVVRVQFGDSLRSLGTVTVAKENMKNINLTYKNENEIVAPTEYKVEELGKESTLVSTGTNDLVWKFVPTEAGEYKFNSATDMNTGKSIYVYDENLQVVASYSDKENVKDFVTVAPDEDSYSTTVVYNKNYAKATLEAGKVYYVKVVPKAKDENGQGCGNVYLTISKYVAPVATARPTNYPYYDNDEDYYPVVRPSATPTVRPSATPIVRPSATPTVRPSATPTVRPSATLTVRPSATPTAGVED